MQDRFALKDIAAFVRVLELGSFKAAAHDLSLTPSALTQRLQKLEDAVGARLIDRTTRTVAVTAVGRAFLPSARRLLDQFDRSITDLQDMIHARGGRVTIASLISIATYVLPPALARFSAAYPDVSVRTIDDSEQDIAEYVRRGDAEFAVDMRTSDADDDPELSITPIMEDRFVLACRTGHPLAAGGPVGWDRLADMPIVTLGARSGTSRLLTDRLPERARALNWRYEVQHLSTMIGFIEAGIGVGIAPELAMRAIAGRPISYRPIVDPAFSRTVLLVERRGATLSPSASALKAMLLEEFSGAPCSIASR